MRRSKGKTISGFESINDLTSLDAEKKFAKRATMDLLVAEPREVVDGFLTKITNAASSTEISRIMVDVRHTL